MIQRKFLCRDMETAEDAVGKIKDIVSETPHRSALVTYYESGFSRQEIETLTDRFKEAGSPELKVAGISVTVVAELLPETRGILLNLIVTDEAEIEVVTVPCMPGGEAEAAGMLRTRLDACAHVRAVELFGSNMELNTTMFMEKSMEGHGDAVLFGTCTLRNLMAKVSVEEKEKIVEVEQTGPDLQGNEFVAGDGIIYDGFVAVIFAGENLKVRSNYALGWNPIGRSFPVELGEKPVRGETIVKTINSRPAVDIYKEYLGVYPDAFFISNICEFPLVVEREGINICLIPIDHGSEGELNFMMTLHPGEKLRFTFASHDEVLHASRISLDIMEKFQPEAMFLTLCGNRINYLKEDAHIEWDEFSKVSPDHALMHGSCELYYHEGRGGILNSAHLTVGFREKEEAANASSYEHPTLEGMRQGRTLPLSDRMSAFLGKITKELLDIAEEARSANEAKSAFLSHMSHEIRTPINAILGMDEMILNESRENDTLDYADSIRSAGNNLLGIVNDILDISKIEAGKMNIVPGEYELPSLIKDLYNVVKVRAKEKGLRVKLDIDETLPGKLYGDDTRVRQVISNMLTNAVKYTEKGTVTLIMKNLGPVTLENPDALPAACPGQEAIGGYVRIGVRVKDTGIGIRPEDMEKLFDEYERFDEKRNKKVEGTGLGLSITKELLELMGSRLTVSSDYGKGSEFGFEIVQGVISNDGIGDKNNYLKRTVEKTKHLSFTAEDARILVVDDSAVNLTVFCKLLKNTKIRIDAVKSGEQALRLVKQREYDVIFLDHLMPEMDGTQTLKRMKEMEDNLSADTPVICLTANAMSNAREEYLKEGFRDYISKPVHIEELESLLFYYIPPEKIRTLSEEEILS
ncbi:MAG: response regulator [Lachnospiraceae bacterium]|nr:response regulator [Lachnospiraceae bacterium]